MGGNPLSYIDPLGLDSDSITSVCPECTIPAIRAVPIIKKVIDACFNSGTKNTDASAPTGQRGSPMDVSSGTNSPATTGSRDYSGHALDQMQGRGITPSTVENAINNGAASSGNTVCQSARGFCQQVT